jgi:CheY-like chemotaxis protein
MHKILVVEDVEIARNVMNLILKKINCNVDMAKNGIEALKLYFANKYDLIFMDLGLPDINGVTITKIIRSYEKVDSLPVRVVAITTHEDTSHREECFNVGMDAFLTKPVDISVVQNIVNELMSSRIASN